MRTAPCVCGATVAVDWSVPTRHGLLAGVCPDCERPFYEHKAPLIVVRCDPRQDVSRRIDWGLPRHIRIAGRGRRG